MITTMMLVIIVIIILVPLMILVLKMTKKYHITWYWCQDKRDSYIAEKMAKKFGQGSSPPFRAMPERNFFLYRRCCSLTEERLGWWNLRSTMTLQMSARGFKRGDVWFKFQFQMLSNVFRCFWEDVMYLAPFCCCSWQHLPCFLTDTSLPYFPSLPYQYWWVKK